MTPALTELHLCPPSFSPSLRSSLAPGTVPTAHRPLLLHALEFAVHFPAPAPFLCSSLAPGTVPSADRPLLLRALAAHACELLRRDASTTAVVLLSHGGEAEQRAVLQRTAGQPELQYRLLSAMARLEQVATEAARKDGRGGGRRQGRGGSDEEVRCGEGWRAKESLHTLSHLYSGLYNSSHTCGPHSQPESCPRPMLLAHVTPMHAGCAAPHTFPHLSHAWRKRPAVAARRRGAVRAASLQL